MKAIIMAGGQGKRLKAVSGDHPKPMTPLLGKPVMEHIIALLARQGFDDVCATVRYGADEIMDYFSDGSRFGVKLRYSVETEALGTAGGVRLCRDFYGDDSFLVISGDAACDFELGVLAKEHNRSGAAATLALSRQPEPLRYGLAVTDIDGAVRCFIEKPCWPQVVTDAVNTGIYMLSPRAMDYVPENSAYDFGKELFPLLIQRGERLAGLTLNGYWCDIGTPLSYYKCCVDALTGKLRIEGSPDFLPEESSAEVAAATSEGESVECECLSRAALMGAMSELMCEMGADYSDGIRLHGKGYELHISPLAARSAIRISVQSSDAEFSKELAFSAKRLAQALEL